LTAPAAAAGCSKCSTATTVDETGGVGGEVAHQGWAEGKRNSEK